MEKVLSPENFDFAARDLLAGLILIAGRGRHVIGERRKRAESVTLSLFGQAIFQRLLRLAPLAGHFSAPSGRGCFVKGRILSLPGLASGLARTNGGERSSRACMARDPSGPSRLRRRLCPPRQRFRDGHLSRGTPHPWRLRRQIAGPRRCEA